MIVGEENALKRLMKIAPGSVKPEAKRKSGGFFGFFKK